MARARHTRRIVQMEEAIIVLFCLVDVAYRNLNPKGSRYASLKKLSDLEVLALSLFHQL